MKTLLLLILSVGLLTTALPGQAPIDILLRRQGSTYTVSLLPSGPVDGLVSNLQLTLAIPADDPNWTWSPVAGQAGYLPLEAAAPPALVAGSLRQKIVAFGLARLQSQGVIWPAGTEVPILTFTYSGAGIAALSYAAWATANNGTYYVEIDGEPRTGVVRHDGFPVANSPLAGGYGLVSLYPNPTPDQVRLVWDSPEAAPVAVRCQDLLGRTLWTRALAARPGRQHLTLSLAGLADGLYLLDIRQAGLPPQAVRVQKGG